MQYEIIRIDGVVKSIIQQKKKQATSFKKPFRLKKPPRSISVKGQQRAYLSDIIPFIKELKRITEEILYPQIENIIATSKSERPKLDSFSDDIESLMEKMRLKFFKNYSDAQISFFAKRAAERLENFNAKEFEKQFKRVLNIDLHRVEPWLSSEIKGFVSQNVSLIKSIPDQYFNRVEQSVLRGIQSGKLTSAIKEEIQQAYSVSESRATLIARDQIAKFNGNLTELRQKSVGVSKYIWSISLDERVRPDHAEKEGNVYYWNDPPADTGHPGQDFQCRCSALPVFDDE